MNRRRIARATAVIMLGTLASSVLGFARAFVVARLFGAGANTDAFFAALAVPQSIYDQLVGVAIAAVFIPSFARLAEEDRFGFRRAVRSSLVVVGGSLLAVILALEVLAGPLMALMASGFGLHTSALAVGLLRLTLPALVFLGLAAVVTSALFSQQRRAAAAFAGGCYHLGVIGAAVLASARWGIVALPAGVIAGAALQLAVQAFFLRRARPRGPRRARRPAGPILRRMLRLYLPAAAMGLVAVVGVAIDIGFKSHLPQAGGLSDMHYATQLVQFPVGIVAAALGLAVLPSLSTDAGAERLESFKRTLVLGLRLVILLMVPAMVGLLTLSTPIVALLFERGHFSHLATIHSASAVVGYAPQLPFVGFDQLLVVAFYARHNTVTPMLVGMIGIAVYTVAAAILLGPLSIFGLALANTIQLAVHALLLLFLLARVIGPLPWGSLGEMLLKVGLAGMAMGGAILAVETRLELGDGLTGRLAAVILPGAVAVAVYGALLVLLRVDEAQDAWESMARRRGGPRPQSVSGVGAPLQRCAPPAAGESSNAGP